MKKIALISSIVLGTLFTGCHTVTYYQTEDGKTVLQETCSDCDTCKNDPVYDNRLPTETCGNCCIPKIIYKTTKKETSKEKPIIKQTPIQKHNISQTPGLMHNGIITVEATGVGVAPNSSISPAQSTVMARRSAILDGYKALTEKLYGIKINGRETVRNMILQNANLRAKIEGVIRGASIEDEDYKNGMYKVRMSLKLNLANWNRYLRNNPPYSTTYYDN